MLVVLVMLPKLVPALATLGNKSIRSMIVVRTAITIYITLFLFQQRTLPDKVRSEALFRVHLYCYSSSSSSYPPNINFISTIIVSSINIKKMAILLKISIHFYQLRILLYYLFACSSFFERRRRRKILLNIQCL